MELPYWDKKLSKKMILLKYEQSFTLSEFFLTSKCFSIFTTAGVISRERETDWYSYHWQEVCFCTSLPIKHGFFLLFLLFSGIDV